MSRKARQFLRSMGVVLQRPHTGVELGNFAAGTGQAYSAMPYHVIGLHGTTGDSKTTLGWAATLTDARAQLGNIRAGHATTGQLHGYYIRDIRDGSIYR